MSQAFKNTEQTPKKFILLQTGGTYIYISFGWRYVTSNTCITFLFLHQSYINRIHPSSFAEAPLIFPSSPNASEGKTSKGCWTDYIYTCTLSTLLTVLLLRCAPRARQRSISVHLALQRLPRTIRRWPRGFGAHLGCAKAASAYTESVPKLCKFPNFGRIRNSINHSYSLRNAIHREIYWSISAEKILILVYL